MNISKRYLRQPRGKGWTFRMETPTELIGVKTPWNRVDPAAGQIGETARSSGRVSTVVPNRRRVRPASPGCGLRRAPSAARAAHQGKAAEAGEQQRQAGGQRDHGGVGEG